MNDSVRILIPRASLDVDELHAPAARLVELGAKRISVEEQRAAGQEFLKAVVLHRGGRHLLTTSEGSGAPLYAQVTWMAEKLTALASELELSNETYARLDALAIDAKAFRPCEVRKTDSENSTVSDLRKTQR